MREWVSRPGNWKKPGQDAVSGRVLSSVASPIPQGSSGVTCTSELPQPGGWSIILPLRPSQAWGCPGWVRSKLIGTSRSQCMKAKAPGT